MTTDRPAHRRYVAHLNRCRAAGAGRWCQACLDLIREADAESWRRSADRTAA